MLNGMENDNITYKTIKGVPNAQLLSEIVLLYTAIFNDADVSFFYKRIQENPKLFSVLAYYNNKLVGFKIGYPKNKLVFYSWIGGVDESFREKGIGKTLALTQEQWVRKQGFKSIQTKSMNRFKPMMILNLKNGFNIIKVYTNDSGQTKVVFEKVLE